MIVWDVAKAIMMAGDWESCGFHKKILWIAVAVQIALFYLAA